MTCPITLNTISFHQNSNDFLISCHPENATQSVIYAIAGEVFKKFGTEVYRCPLSRHQKEFFFVPIRALSENEQIFLQKNSDNLCSEEIQKIAHFQTVFEKMQQRPFFPPIPFSFLNAVPPPEFLPLYELGQRNFIGICLRRHSLRNLQLNGADFRYADLRNSDLQQTVFRFSNLENATFQSANLRGCDLRDSNLKYCNLSHANLIGASLEDADLSYALLIGSNLTQTNIKGASFRETNLNATKISQEQFRQIYSSGRRDFSGVNFCEVSFRNCLLRNVNFRNANLENADLRNANLEGADLRESNLEGARLNFSDRIKKIFSLGPWRYR